MSPHHERVPLAHVARRGAGKTYQLLRWVSEGERTQAYPHWSRVLVVPDLIAAHRLTAGLAVDCPWRSCVWTVRELRAAFDRGAVHPGTIQYAVDDADLLLRQALGVHQGPARLALLAEVAALPPATCRATHPILNGDGDLTCVDAAGHAPATLHTDPTHGAWMLPDREEVTAYVPGTARRGSLADPGAGHDDRLREAATRAREVLPQTVAAAVENALCDDGRDWALGYHERLADEVLALASGHVVEHGQLYGGGAVLVRPEDPDGELERVWPLADWITANSRFGGHVLRRRVLVLEDWVDVSVRDGGDEDEGEEL